MADHAADSPTEQTTEGVKVVRQKKMGFFERSYVPEIVKGLGVTLRQFFRAATGKNYRDKNDDWFLNEGNVTYQYPEDPKPYPARYRGRHRLMLREDGDVRCVACMCCSTICPANCIHITAAEHDDPAIEKYPTSFVIDELRCIFCGFCVEACPCDAIRMDTGRHVEPFYDRNHAYFTLRELMAYGEVSAAAQGGADSQPVMRPEGARAQPITGPGASRGGAREPAPGTAAPHTSDAH